MPLSDNARAAIFMSLSMAGFILNDTIAKFVAEDMNMGQFMFIRGIFASLLITALAWRRKALVSFVYAFRPMVLLRIFGEVGGTVTFLIALANLPLANVSAILQALPLAVTMGAALFLNEPVGWRRWTAIIVGFIGMLIVLRPGLEGFSTWSLLVVGTVFFAALRDIATRLTPPEIPSLFLSVVTAPVVMVVGALIATPLGGWEPVSGSNLVWTAVAAGLLLVGYQFIILAMRTGEISAIAPFRYTSLIWAILLGVVVFGDWPDGWTIVGSVVIVLSGLYTLYRERVVQRQAAAANRSAASPPPSGAG